jgi:hypothetical protein
MSAACFALAHPRSNVRSHSLRLVWREHHKSARDVVQLLKTPGTLHDASRSMAPRAQEEMPELVSHYIAKKDSLRNPATVGKLLCETVGRPRLPVVRICFLADSKAPQFARLRAAQGSATAHAQQSSQLFWIETRFIHGAQRACGVSPLRGVYPEAENFTGLRPARFMTA